MLHQHLFQCIAGNRLDKMSVKAGARIQIQILASGICGQHHHRRCPVESADLIPDLLHTFDPVHFRHQVIHQDHIIMIAHGHLQRISPAESLVDLHSGAGQQPCLNLQVHLIVIHDQDLCLRRTETALVGFFLYNALIVDIQFPDHCRIRNALSHRKDKGGSLSVHTVDRDRSVHQFRQLLHDGKAKSGSFDMPVSSLIHTLECIKQIRQRLSLDPDPCIRDRDAKFRRTFVHRLAFHVKFHLSAFRIFHGIV